MSADKEVLNIYLDSEEPYGDSVEELSYLLEMNPGQHWNLWLLKDGVKASREFYDLSPLEAFSKLASMPVVIDVFDLNGQGFLEEVAYQDWDSGGPGAGAGRVSVFRFGNTEVGSVYFGVHDAGFTDAYDTLSSACAASGIYEQTDATLNIWCENEEE